MDIGTAGLRERLQTALGGAYTLERELGGGGMSHVFVAHDAALGRDVVVKVLPPDAAAALSVERFRREIALAARLQHPHIVPVLAAGVTADGLPYYTMPLVDGESLRARLARTGELPVPEAVSILKDVARALAHAHARGVVHRDVKPENVLLAGGAAVVTDFGVAKALDASTTAGDGTPLTRLGLALGTPAYMAPEQAAADPTVDHRADLYALGCVAYELLTGQPPFAGRPAPALLAAHVSERPEPVGRRRPNVPAALAVLVMRCLEKRPADRPASADEVLRALDAPAEGAPAPPRRLPRGVPRRVPLVAALALTGAAAGAAGWALRAPPAADADAPVVRVAVALDADESPRDLGCPSYALSPDGRLLVYATVKGGIPVLRVRASDRLESRTLEGVVSPRCATMSPDGRRIAFASEGELRTVAVDGGPTTRLPAPPLPAAFAGATWATPETLVLSDGAALWAVSSGGGPARRLAMAGDSAVAATPLWPRALPGGEGVLYARVVDGDVADARLAVVSLDGRRSAVLDVAGTYPVGVVAGRLVYVDAAGALRAVAFDARRWRTHGEPVTVMPRVERTAAGAAAVALSASGTLAYLSGGRLASPVLVDRRGGRRLLPLPARPYAHPRFSPDGTRIAFSLADGSNLLEGAVWIHDLASATLTRLTTGAGATRPEWSPDGRRVLYVRAEARRRMSLWWQPVDGSAPASPLQATHEDLMEGVLTPDGHTLVYRTRGARGARDILAAPVDGGRAGAPRPVVAGPAGELTPRLSPDGRWLAYTSDESGTLQIYVRPFPGPGGRVQVSVDEGTEPLWSRDGRHLFYRDGPRVIDATVRTAPAFAVVAREPFAEGSFDADWAHPTYDVSPDGEHLLLLERAGAPQQIVVVHRWARELHAATGERTAP